MAIREFADYEAISAYALPAMDWCVNAGLLNGSDNTLMPQGPATCAQVANNTHALHGKRQEVKRIARRCDSVAGFPLPYSRQTKKQAIPDWGSLETQQKGFFRDGGSPFCNREAKM